jgi:addiction module HigA family antidote
LTEEHDMLPKKRITTHPGEVLQAEFLEPLGISQSELARHIGVMPYVVCELANGRRGVSPRMAVMLSRAFGVSPEFWMGLQADYDLSTLMQSSAGKRVQGIPPMVQPRKAV